MKKQFARLAVAMGLICMPLLSGCGGGGSSRFSMLQFGLSSTKAVYARGEAVPLTFTVKNTGTNPVAFVFGSGSTHTFKVEQSGQLVFQPFFGGGAVITQISLAAGETKALSDSLTRWTQVDMQGNQVADGQYTIRAYLVECGVDGATVTAEEAERDLAAEPALITIQGG